MSKVLIEEQTLYDIGDAIREKMGESATYKPGEMANAIMTGSAGSGRLNLLLGDTVDHYYESTAPHRSIFSAITHSGTSSSFDWSKSTMVLNGETVDCVQTPVLDGFATILLTPIDTSIYRRLFITCSYNDASSGYHVAQIMFYTRPVLDSRYGESSYKFSSVPTLREQDSYQSLSASEVEAQTGLTIHVNDDLSISPQTIEYDLSNLKSNGLTYIGPCYLGFYAFRGALNIREIYCTP